MKVAVISDIHSNLYALKSVYDSINDKGIDKIYCAGDVVGYLTDPNGVIEFLKEKNIICILGNHDLKYSQSEKRSDEETNNLSIETLQSGGSFYYNDKILTDENREYLRELPRSYEISNNNITLKLVHGSPLNISEYMYEEDDKEKFMESITTDGVIFGHTHIPYHQIVNGKHFINPGSVGKPKHGNSKSSYVIIDITNEIQCEFIQVEYPLDELIKEIEVEPWIKNSLINDLRQ